MQLVFLASARRDLRWMHRYYTTVFPDGRARAQRQYRALLSALKTHPRLGHPSEAHPDVRELAIPRTPFLLLYRIRPGRIEVLRLVDTRSGWRT